MVRALIFDFDGLILDTEVPDFQSWRETYEAHGCTLSEAVWTSCVGTGEADMLFDPYADLEAQLGREEGFEDPPNGVLAAHRAGTFTVAVPNALTRGLDFGPADLLLETLAETSLEELLRHVPSGASLP